MFRWKSSHQAAPAVAHRQTSALLQLRISGKNSRFQNIFRGHTRHQLSEACGSPCPCVIGTKNPYQTRCNNNGMACIRSICEYELARGKDRTISVIFFFFFFLMASVLAKFADFSSLCCQVGVQNGNPGDIFTCTSALQITASHGNLNMDLKHNSRRLHAGRSPACDKTKVQGNLIQCATWWGSHMTQKLAYMKLSVKKTQPAYVLIST